jgi:hypothetical protein
MPSYVLAIRKARVDELVLPTSNNFEWMVYYSIAQKPSRHACPLSVLYKKTCFLTINVTMPPY